MSILSRSQWERRPKPTTKKKPRMGGGASRVHMGGEPGSVRGTCDDEGGSSPVTDYHNCMTRRRRIDDRQ